MTTPATSGRSRMFRRSALATLPRMVITITVESKDPFSGSIAGEGRAVTFAGWLALLRLLSEFASDHDLEGSPRGFGGELDPGRQPELSEDVRDVGLDGPA